MKVLFLSRATLFKVKGGDTIQVLNTAKYLRNLGVKVDIGLAHEHFDFQKYDLIHFFNVIRPADILVHTTGLKIPYVVSTIYVDYSEYESKVRGLVTRILHNLFSSDFIEYLKVIARFIKNGEKINSWNYIFLGHRKAVINVINSSAYLLPNSDSEYLRLSKDYKIHHPYKAIPNGIEENVFAYNNNIKKEPLILCVSRIEGLKNQLNLIKAVNGTAIKLIIIGSPAPNNLSYYSECKRIAQSNTQFIANISQEELVPYYQKAKAHILPSWFETTGLSSLEAATMGCNIIVTDKGDTKEYFRDYAYYCKPDDIKSIREAIYRALNEPVNPELTSYIIRKFTWEIAAKKTYDVYRQIIHTT